MIFMPLCVHVCSFNACVRVRVRVCVGVRVCVLMWLCDLWPWLFAIRYLDFDAAFAGISSQSLPFC